ncbi:hypothetical protein FQN54_004772 [Arachnomyces sp. PD_36]|nr:hypothetical protein FQN54_004772 [Arachnomyces sp. PD_36]
MPAPHDHDNLQYGWLAKSKMEEERARMQKFEEDKARKEKYKPLSPWPAEAWVQAYEARKRGHVEPEKRFPVIITSSTGPFPTPDKVKEVVDLPSTPEVKRTTRTTLSEVSDATELEKQEVEYCDVNWKQLVRVRDYSEGNNVIVWFQGKRRFAWLAHSVKEPQEGNADIGNDSSAA